MSVTAVLAVVTAIAVGATGAAVLIAVVVIPAGAEERLVAVKVKGPPNEPVVIF